MSIKLVLSMAMLFSISQLKSQEVVMVLQPVMNSYLRAGQQLTDSTARYFLGSRESNYLSNSNTYFADFNASTGELSIQSPVDTFEGNWRYIAGSYEFFHVSIENGSAIIGSNGFECDITLAQLAYVTKEGTFNWLLDHSTSFPVDIIDSIGFVALDVWAVIGENGQSHYFDVAGNELFYEEPPIVYFNIISQNGFNYGIRYDGVYKLNSDFESVMVFPINNPLFFHSAGNNEFVVSTLFGTVLLNEELEEISSNPEITRTFSIARTSDSFWMITPEGLYQVDSSLQVLDYYSPEPFETMRHVWAYHDTVFVGSEYNGNYHQDIVIRKYGPGITATNSIDVAITSLYIDTVIRVPDPGGFGYSLLLDSVMVEIQNHGVDTITSLVINWDWQLFFAFCQSIYGEIIFENINIPPSQSQELQVGPFVTSPFVAHIDQEFCFWVDFANRQPDVNPGNNRFCFETEIVNRINELSGNYNFSVSPNPAYDKITIDWGSEISNERLNINSGDGRLVYSTPVSGSNLTLDIQDWVTGVYYILIKNGDRINYLKFVKQ